MLYKKDNPRFNIVEEYQAVIDSYLPGGWNSERFVEKYDIDKESYYNERGKKWTISPTYEIFYINYENNKGTKKEWKISTLDMWFGENNLSSDEVMVDSIESNLFYEIENLMWKTQYSLDGADEVFKVSEIGYEYSNMEEELLNNIMKLSFTDFDYHELEKLKDVKIYFTLVKNDNVTDEEFQTKTEEYMQVLQGQSSQIEFISR